MKICQTIIDFQLFLLSVITAAERVIENEISQGSEPTNAYSINTPRTMDENFSPALITKPLHHKELLFSPRLPNHSSASLDKDFEKTAAQVSILYTHKSKDPENIQRTRESNFVDSTTTRNHEVSLSAIPDIARPLKTSEQIEIRETPLEILQSGMDKTAIPSEATVTNTAKRFTVLEEHGTSTSVHFSQTAVKYTDLIKATSSLGDKTPKAASMSGKLEQTSVMTEVNELHSRAIFTPMFSKASVWNTNVGTLKTVVRFPSMVSSSYKYISSVYVTENNLEHSKRPTTSLTLAPTGKSVELSASRIIIPSESRVLPKLFSTITGSIATARKQKIYGSAMYSTLVTSKPRFTENLLKQISATIEGKKSPYSTEPSAYSIAPLSRRVVFHTLSRNLSGNNVGSTAETSGVGISVSQLISSSGRLQTKTAILQILPSPSATRHFDISQSILSDESSPLPLASPSTSSPINLTQELSKTKTLLSKKTFTILKIKDNISSQNVFGSQTFFNQTVTMVGRKLENRTFTSDIMKPSQNLTASNILKDSATIVQRNFSTLDKNIANARTSTFEREYKMDYTQSKFQSNLFLQNTPSLATAQGSFSTALFTSKPLVQRIVTSKVLPLLKTQVVSSTPSKDTPVVSLWLLESPSIGVPRQSPATTPKARSSFHLINASKSTTKSNIVLQKQKTFTSVQRLIPTQVPLPSPSLKTVDAAKFPGGTHGDVSVATTVKTVLSATQQTSRLPMLLAIALIPSILLIIFVFAFFIWRHRRKKNSGPVYSITVEYGDQARPAMAHQNSWIDLTRIKGIHIDLEFPNSEKRKSAIISTAPQKGLSEIQTREFQLPKLRQTIAKPKDYSLSWLNGIIKRQIEVPLPESDERSSTGTRRPLSVYSAKEKENYEPNEKVTRHESLKCTRETPRYEPPKFDRKAPYSHEFELTNEGFDMSLKEKNKEMNSESIASNDTESFVCSCTENQNSVSGQTLENKQQEVPAEDILIDLPKSDIPTIKPSQVNSDFNKPNTVVDNVAKRYDFELEDFQKDNSLLPIPSRRRVLMLRSRFESL